MREGLPGSRSERDSSRGLADRNAGRASAWAKYKVILAFVVFGLFAVVGVVLLLTERTSPVSASGIILLSGGFVVMGGSLLPFVQRMRPPGLVGNLLKWLFLLIGSGMWCAVPVILLVNGYAWSDLVFGRTTWKNAPVWLLAVVVWSVGLLMLTLLVRQLSGHISQRKARVRPRDPA